MAAAEALPALGSSAQRWLLRAGGAAPPRPAGHHAAGAGGAAGSGTATIGSGGGDSGASWPADGAPPQAYPLEPKAGGTWERRQFGVSPGAETLRSAHGGPGDCSQPVPLGQSIASQHVAPAVFHRKNDVQGTSAWVPVKPVMKSDRCPTPGVQEDKQVLAESMINHLSTLFAFMHQTLSRERAGHSSNVSLMMRKVEKDLSDTLRSVREIFASLTEQLVLLVIEVESSRKQVKSIQDKYAAAKRAAEAQSQYVRELESVLDSQGQGVSEVFHTLSAQATNKSQALSKLSEDSKARERALHEENRQLRLQLQRTEEAQKQLLPECLPPMLPEMPASWTRRTPAAARTGTGSPTRAASQGEVHGTDGHRCRTTSPSTPSRGASWGASRGCDGRGDIVGSVLAHCDAARGVARSKVQQPAGRAATAHSPLHPVPQRPLTSGAVVEEIAHRAELAEARCQKQHNLVIWASASLLLLRDVFVELRNSQLLVAEGALDAGNAGDATLAVEVLGRVVRLFQGAVPKLGSLPEVLSALNLEIASLPPTCMDASTGAGGMEQCGTTGGSLLRCNRDFEGG